MSKRIDFLIATGLTGIVLAGGIVLAMPEPQPAGWGGAGAVQSISISLGSGQATQGEAETPEESADSEDSKQGEKPVNEVEPQPEPVPEPVVETVPEPDPEPIVEPEPVPEPVVEEVVEPEPEISPLLADVMPVRRKPEPPKATPERAKAPKPVEKAEVKPVVQPSGGPVDSVKSEGTVGEATQSQAASSASGSGGGAAMSSAAFTDYQAAVVQMLMRYREYPDRAKRRGIEGQNMVRLVIQRDGTVSFFEMTSPSGSSILDRATQDMIERVKRFPPFPEDMARTEMTLTIPVIYDLR
ncbi:energy transducer TonB [Thalassospira sp. MCCC 1A03138]|uniref:energy transducer TonB n=1 Tax=Thalassospira sp. MCCC 1A03138 TaxID=1470576 RepID=UPI000A1E3836|nr:energy transducer TonB [Thalassospira sp. MCCC 1A03138]OSQ30106.1 energy transducer TonB [Thalassospira sp. MCCC 1A03138]